MPTQMLFDSWPIKDTTEGVLFIDKNGIIHVLNEISVFKLTLTIYQSVPVITSSVLLASVLKLYVTPTIMMICTAI